MLHLKRIVRFMMAFLLISGFFMFGCTKEREIAEKYSLSLNLNTPEVQSRKVTINGGVAAPIASIQWDWGDGNLEKHHVFPASHTYATPGQYEVKVTAYGKAKDCSEQKFIQVQIP